MLASNEGHIDVVKYLVDNGADTRSIQTYINVHDNDDNTALTLASGNRNTNIVEYLTSKGATSL